jgi:peptide/nickel transport system ATP-binding protein
MKSRPILNEEVNRLYSIPGNVPNPINMPQHCYFKNRCEKCMEQCSGAYPGLVKVTPTHKVCCYLYSETGSAKAQGTAAGGKRYAK